MTNVIRTFQIRHFVNTRGNEVVTFGLRERRGGDRSYKGTLLPLDAWTVEERAKCDTVARTLLGDEVQVEENPTRRGGRGGWETARGSSTTLIYCAIESN